MDRDITLEQVNVSDFARSFVAVHGDASEGFELVPADLFCRDFICEVVETLGDIFEVEAAMAARIAPACAAAVILEVYRRRGATTGQEVAA